MNLVPSPALITQSPAAGWRKLSRGESSVPNHYVLRRNGRDVGQIDRPPNSNTDRNAWRAYAGIGYAARFIGHAWSKAAAAAMVEREAGI